MSQGAVASRAKQECL